MLKKELAEFKAAIEGRVVESVNVDSEGTITIQVKAGKLVTLQADYDCEIGRYGPEVQVWIMVDTENV